MNQVRFGQRETVWLVQSIGARLLLRRAVRGMAEPGSSREGRAYPHPTLEAFPCGYYGP